MSTIEDQSAENKLFRLRADAIDTTSEITAATKRHHEACNALAEATATSWVGVRSHDGNTALIPCSLETDSYGMLGEFQCTVTTRDERILLLIDTGLRREDFPTDHEAELTMNIAGQNTMVHYRRHRLPTKEAMIEWLSADW